MQIEEPRENYTTGWIKIFRSVKGHWVWKDPMYFKMWIDFLMRANHKENKVLFDANLILVKRGEFITSQLKLAKEYRTSRNKIRRFLDLLEDDLMIVQNTTSKYTKITVCNYDVYQDRQPTESQQPTNGRTTEGQHRDTNKNDKNVENEKELKTYMLFDAFWDAYDKKVGNKNKLIKKWNLLSSETQEKIMKHVELYKISQPNKKYRKNPETYFNNESWNDELIFEEKTEPIKTYPISDVMKDILNGTKRS
jgi:DNA replication protein DnaD